jgi:hypothetical protein
LLAILKNNAGWDGWTLTYLNLKTYQLLSPPHKEARAKGQEKARLVPSQAGLSNSARFLTEQI